MRLSTFVGIFCILLGGWLLVTGLTGPNDEKEKVTAGNQEVVISNEQDSNSMWRNYTGIIAIVGGTILVFAPLFRNNPKTHTH